MMARKFIGLCAITTSLLAAGATLAQPRELNAEQLEQILEGLAQSWDETSLPDAHNMDEQIFIEISPILDSVESVKLPEDQQLSD